MTRHDQLTALQLRVQLLKLEVLGVLEVVDQIAFDLERVLASEADHSMFE